MPGREKSAVFSAFCYVLIFPHLVVNFATVFCLYLCMANQSICDKDLIVLANSNYCCMIIHTQIHPFARIQARTFLFNFLIIVVLLIPFCANGTIYFYFDITDEVKKWFYFYIFLFAKQRKYLLEKL